jgi:site-specific recombinase XerD
MSRKGRGRHTGRTKRGDTRQVLVEKLGKVTIYQRGVVYYLYYRELGKTIRRKIDGNLGVARATAGKVVQSLAEERASPFSFELINPRQLVDRYLNYVEQVQRLSLGTSDRYRAALRLLVVFSEQNQISQADKIDEQVVDDFVRWLRQQNRARNGSKSGKQQKYSLGGIEYVLSTCRTAFNWARRRKLLPSYCDNPFSQVQKEALKDRGEDEQEITIFSPEQELKFFEACDDWQRGVFGILAAYGMRVGELTHLLVEDVDFANQVIHIRSKPEFYWFVKTRRCRQLPMTPAMEKLLRDRIGLRKAGFVFRARAFDNGKRPLAHHFSSPKEQREFLLAEVTKLEAQRPATTDKQKRNFVRSLCRTLGWLPETRIREEFMKVTEQIGCPEFTRAHNLRHLFITRSQEGDLNPLLVAEIVGQRSIETTRRYTHLGAKSKRETLTRLLEGNQEPCDEAT